LITSCDECNSGKGGNTIEQSVPNETHRLRLAQEFQEQNALNKAATEAAKLEIEARQSIVNAYCDLFGRDSMQNKCVNNYHCLLKQYGAKLLFEWLRIASANLPNESDTNVVKYIYGIRRNYEADLEYEEEKNSGKK